MTRSNWEVEDGVEPSLVNNGRQERSASRGDGNVEEAK
jgi:hypothetical protein